MMTGSFGNPILMGSFKIEIPDASFSDSYNRWGNFYLLFGNTETRLIQLFRKLKKIDFSDQKNEFLNNSLNRFMKSYTRHWEEERITDLVICLESLLLGNNTTSKGETLSRRVSTLLEEPSARNDLHDFIKTAYKIRSKESHGRSQQSIKIGNEQYSPSDFAKKLEDHARKAFIQFLDFQLTGKTWDNMILKLSSA
ncbi:MAG: HEPN domain-containing protein [Nitrosopumilus sp.]|nr:HEPN domain-containing protein [Nitrosopumilus sp.]